MEMIGDEGLSKLSSMYQEIMDKLGIKYSNIYTEDGITDGKYLTTINFENGSKIELDTSAWNEIKVVTANIESVYETYNNLSIESEKIQNKNDIEIEY